MAQTTSQLVSRVMYRLGLLEAGATPATEEAALISGPVATILADLAARNIIYIGNADAIEDHYFEALIRYCAKLLGPEFGKDEDEAGVQRAERNLRTLARIGRGTGDKLAVDDALLSGPGSFNFTTGQ